VSQNPGTKEKTVNNKRLMDVIILIRLSKLNNPEQTAISLHVIPKHATIAKMHVIKQNGLSPGIILFHAKLGNEAKKGITKIGGLVNKKASKSHPAHTYEQANVNIANPQI
jgi:hypothetical protein